MEKTIRVMKKNRKLMLQIAIRLGALAVPVVFAQAGLAQLSDFTTGAVVDLKANATAVAGEFLPTGGIDLKTAAVVLTVDTVSVTFAPGSFTKTLTGGYVASTNSGSIKVGILLHPLKTAKWVYSAAIGDFSSPSTSVTVGLQIGGQAGSATGKAFVFPRN
jgi:hypothetical protein